MTCRKAPGDRDRRLDGGAEVNEMRYMIEVSSDHAEVVLTDTRTGEIHQFTGPRALFDALGVLAEWRDRDQVAP